MSKVRERAPEKVRGAVLKAAEKLFAMRGFAGTSMRDLAKESGVSQPLIHHHFGSKQGLYSAVKGHVLERFHKEWQRVREKIAENRESKGATETAPVWLSESTRLFFDFLRRNPMLLRLASWARLEGERDLWPGEMVIRQTVDDFWRQQQADGNVRPDVDPAVISIIVESIGMYWMENRVWLEQVIECGEKGRRAKEAHYMAGVFDVLLKGVKA